VTTRSAKRHAEKREVKKSELSNHQIARGNANKIFRQPNEKTPVPDRDAAISRSPGLEGGQDGPP